MWYQGVCTHTGIYWFNRNSSRLHMQDQWKTQIKFNFNSSTRVAISTAFPCSTDPEGAAISTAVPCGTDPEGGCYFNNISS